MNPMTLISDEWMLITAGTQERGYNTMTACWGHMGAIWGHGEGLPTTIIYIRPQRYTKEFIDREEFYTLSSLKNIKRLWLILELIPGVMKIKSPEWD